MFGRSAVGARTLRRTPTVSVRNRTERSIHVHFSDGRIKLFWELDAISHYGLHLRVDRFFRDFCMPCCMLVAMQSSLFPQLTGCLGL